MQGWHPWRARAAVLASPPDDLMAHQSAHSKDAPAAADHATSPCPACSGVRVHHAGQLHEDVCTTCGARVFPPACAQELCARFLELTTSDLAALGAVHTGGVLSCPHCQQRMRRIPVRNQQVDACMGCGALVLRQGQLAALTGGQVQEVMPALGPPSPSNRADWARLVAWVPLTLLAPVVVSALATSTQLLQGPLQRWVVHQVWLAQMLVRLVHAAVLGCSAPALWLVAVGLAPAWRRDVLRYATPLGAVVVLAQGLTALGSWGAAGLGVPLLGALSVAWTRRQERVLLRAAGETGPVPTAAVVALASRSARQLAAGAAVVAAVLVVAGVARTGWDQRGGHHCLAGASMERQTDDAGLVTIQCVLPNGDAHGYHQVEDASGAVLTQGHFRNGQRHGRFLAFYADGSPRFVHGFSHGKRTGLWEEWHPNGQLRLQGAYRQDARSGPWISFHDNGNPHTEGLFSAHKPVGRWTRWTRDGALDESWNAAATSSGSGGFVNTL